MPYSENAEKATLGAMLFNIESSDMILNTLSADDFYITKHKNLFKSIKRFRDYNNDISVDRIVLEEFLRRENLLEESGGLVYIEELTLNAPTTKSAEKYSEIVKDYSLRRKVIEISDELKNSSLDEAQDIKDTIDHKSSQLDYLSTIGVHADSFEKISNTYPQVLEEILELSKFNIKPGINTGFHSLDELIGGLKPSQYVVVAARPSCGKTAFALSCMNNMIRDTYQIIKKDENNKIIKDVNGNPIIEEKRIKVGFFSLEMPKEDIVRRLFSMASLIKYRDIASNKIVKQEDVNKLYDSIEEYSKISSNFFIYDSVQMSISNIKTAAKTLKRTEDVDILFIDYLSRINTKGIVNGQRAMQGFEIWSAVSRELKNLAAELKIPVVVLTQLNREAETEKPTLANLRDTGAIEQDADIVILLHDPNRNKKDKDSQEQVQDTILTYACSDSDNTLEFSSKNLKHVEAYIAKHRNGSTGKCDLALIGDIIRFSEWDFDRNEAK